MRRSFFCKKLAGVLNQDFRHRDEGKTHKNSREHLITNRTNKEQFKRSAVRNGDVNNHISEHRRLKNHNIGWHSFLNFKAISNCLQVFVTLNNFVVFLAPCYLILNVYAAKKTLTDKCCGNSLKETFYQKHSFSYFKWNVSRQ